MRMERCELPCQRVSVCSWYSLTSDKMAKVSSPSALPVASASFSVVKAMSRGRDSACEADCRATELTEGKSCLLAW